MTETDIDRVAETLLHGFAADLTEPRSNECLYCYVARMLDEFGCDNTLRWARHYRDLRAPRATALESRLGSMGGYCDCEIFVNAVTLVGSSRASEECGELVTPDEPALCRGARAGSTRSCGVWVRGRGSWG